MEKQAFYGIDLGTTYSCIATIDSDENVTVLPNSLTGRLTMPSAVSFDDDGKVLVGEAAKKQLGNKPENTFVFIKREMSNPDFKREVLGKVYDPVQISSYILKELVDSANRKRKDEEGLDPILDVVITVPAYFGNLERERTKEAGKLAGLNVIQVINEPTAAALSYGKRNKTDKKLLVYDLGGGTFDVSIMEVKNHIINTLVSHGDHRLGGADWDRALVDFVLAKIGAKYDDLEPNEQGMMMLAAEDAKQLLTPQEKTTLQFVYNGIQNVEITREEFEAVTEDLLNRTMMLVDETFDIYNKDAKTKLSEKDIDEVLLVGGSSRMPMVMKVVKEKFGENVKLIDPDLAVAKGAALTALQDETGSIKNGLMLGKDKGSRAYGMKAFDERDKEVVFTLIKRNDDLEIERSSKKDGLNFYTHEEGQSSLEFHFYEYESTQDRVELSDATELEGRGGNISWGRPVPKGTPVDIIVRRDKSGTVRVFAECMGAKGEFVLVSAGVGMASR